MRHAYLIFGCIALCLGIAGMLLPLLPTVPFFILAAFCFGRSNPEWERRLIEHKHLGPSIENWRTRGAISMKGKLMAVVALAASATAGLLTLTAPWSIAPGVVALICGSWILTRPTA